MPSPVDALMTFSMGIVSGLLGGMLGLGGGVFLVPFLILGLGLKFQAAAAISLFAVIATSSAVTAARAGRELINLRLGMVLEVATAAGGLRRYVRCAARHRLRKSAEARRGAQPTSRRAIATRQ